MKDDDDDDGCGWVDSDDFPLSLADNLVNTRRRNTTLFPSTSKIQNIRNWLRIFFF